MRTVKMAGKHGIHAFSQFELTKKIVYNLKYYQLTATAKLVLIYLSNCYNPSKPDIFPKQTTIADVLGISERSVIRAIQELIKEGLVLVECKKTNRYKFTQKITSEAPQNEKKDVLTKTDKLSPLPGQSVTGKTDKLAPPYIEQIKEQKNNISDEELNALSAFAVQKGARNVKAYVNTLILNGSYKECLSSFYANKRAKRLIAETKELIAQNAAHAKTCKRPDEFTKSEAIEFIQKTHPSMRKISSTCKMLSQKFGIDPGN